MKEPSDLRSNPFEVLERINDNAYKIDLPGDYGVMYNITVTHLGAYGQRERGRRGKEIRDFVRIS